MEGSVQHKERLWTKRRHSKQLKLEMASKYTDGVVIPTEDIIKVLETLIAPGDRVVLEGNNQKQADFLSRSLAKANPDVLHDLHMIMQFRMSCYRQVLWQIDKEIFTQVQVRKIHQR